MRLHKSLATGIALAALGTGLCTAALAPEHALAGIVIGSKGIAVIRHYGNPTSVLPGLGGAANANAAQAAGANSANPYDTGPGGLPPGIAAPGGGYGGAPSSAGSYNGGKPTYLQMQQQQQDAAANNGSLGPSGVDSSGGMNGTADTTGLVTWTYGRIKNGTTLRFRLDEDGRVVEITASGLNPSPMTRTARGVNLGDAYGKVVRLYGFPEQTDQQGDVMTIKYARTSHIAFRFYKLKLVNIAVAKYKKPQQVTL